MGKVGIFVIEPLLFSPGQTLTFAVRDVAFFFKYICRCLELISARSFEQPSKSLFLCMNFLCFPLLLFNLLGETWPEALHGNMRAVKGR